MNNIDWEILLKHLNGESTSEDEKTLNTWIQLSEDNKKEYKAILKIWNSPDIHFPKPDTAKALEIVKERLQLNKQTQKQANIYSIKASLGKKSFVQSIFSHQFMRAAAVFIVIIGALYYVTDLLISAKMIEVNVDNKNIKKIILSDGTIVTLDAGSYFKYPEKFEGKLREVSLIGEGYFQVSENKNMPFVVNANYAVITVLGTKFNISAWEITNRVDVAVADGKVSLHSIGSNGKDKVVLSKGQISTLPQNGIPAKPEYVDISEYLSWMNHEKYFTDTPVFQVINLIERWYNVKFNLPDDVDTQTRVAFHVKDLPIEEVLDLFSTVMNLNYTQDGKIIIFAHH